MNRDVMYGHRHLWDLMRASHAACSRDERASAKSGAANHRGTAIPDFAPLIWTTRRARSIADDIYGAANSQKRPTVNNLLIDDQRRHLWTSPSCMRRMFGRRSPMSSSPGWARQREIRGGQSPRHGHPRFRSAYLDDAPRSLNRKWHLWCRRQAKRIDYQQLAHRWRRSESMAATVI